MIVFFAAQIARWLPAHKTCAVLAEGLAFFLCQNLPEWTGSASFFGKDFALRELCAVHLPQRRILPVFSDRDKTGPADKRGDLHVQHNHQARWTHRRLRRGEDCQGNLPGGDLGWRQRFETAHALALQVQQRLEETYPSSQSPTVEQIQDMVEKVLIDTGHSRTAKEYILYRAQRTRVREMNTKLMKVYEDLTFKSAAENDIKRENANIDGNTAMGTMLKYGSEGPRPSTKCLCSTRSTPAPTTAATSTSTTSTFLADHHLLPDRPDQAVRGRLQLRLRLPA